MLQDSFLRTITYLRLSVTDRCDLRCQYCLPEDHKNFVEPETWLTFAEIVRVVNIFLSLGVRHLRVTGGEPLTRKNILALIQDLSQFPQLEDLSLSTNATRLEAFAASLYAAGVKRLNVSLDSLDPSVFQEITKGKLEKVLAGLAAAKAAGFTPIKINTVVLKGINDQEVITLAKFCLENNFILRLIETMPMGSNGLDSKEKYYVSLEEVKKNLAKHFTLLPTTVYGAGPAKYFQLLDQKTNKKTTIGLITPLSQHFCATCNRLRLSVDGILYLCLGQDNSLNLREMLRNQASDEELRYAILQAVALKPEKHEFNEKPEQILRFMSFTGG
jgi:cyclic pyranopterin phosphate synthase